MLESLKLDGFLLIKHHQALIRPCILRDWVRSILQFHWPDLYFIGTILTNVRIKGLKIDVLCNFVVLDIHYVQSFNLNFNFIQRVNVFHEAEMAYLGVLLFLYCLFFWCAMVVVFSPTFSTSVFLLVDTIPSTSTIL